MMEEGIEPPPEFHNQPELWPEAEFYWKAFSDLSSDRTIGMGLGPIPFSAIVRYAELYGLADLDEFERLREIVSEVDGEYLSLNAPKSEQDGKMHSLIPISDVAGIGALLDRLGK
jgi:hypothetical protein